MEPSISLRLEINCRAVGPVVVFVVGNPALQAGLGKQLGLWRRGIHHTAPASGLALSRFAFLFAFQLPNTPPIQRPKSRNPS